MAFENRRWVIINVSDVTDEMLSSSLEGKIIRKSSDDSKTILKWEGTTPTVFNGMTIYNHSEILTELAKPEWVNDG